MDEPKAGEEALLPIELGLEPILGELALRGIPPLEDDKEELPPLGDFRPLPPLGGLIPVLLPPRPLPPLGALSPVLPPPRLLPLLLSPVGLATRPDPPADEVL